MTFQHDQKGLIRKIIRISKFTRHSLVNKQLQCIYCWTVKFSQLIQSKLKIFFFKNHAENDSGRLVPDLFSFLEKALDEVKANGLKLSFSKFR